MPSPGSNERYPIKGILNRIFFEEFFSRLSSCSHSGGRGGCAPAGRSVGRVYSWKTVIFVVIIRAMSGRCQSEAIAYKSKYFQQNFKEKRLLAVDVRTFGCCWGIMAPGCNR